MQFGEDRFEMIECPRPHAGDPGQPGELRGFPAGHAQDAPQDLGSHHCRSEEFSAVHILPVEVVGGSTALRLAEPEFLFRAAVQGAEQPTVLLPGSFLAPLPLRDHGGVHPELPMVMLPRKRRERFCHFLLRQAQPGTLGLETGVRNGWPSRSTRVGVCHMAT